MTTALGNFAIMYFTLVRFANELVLTSCSDKQGHYVHLSFEVNLFKKFPESLGYYFTAYCCIFCINILENFISS